MSVLGNPIYRFGDFELDPLEHRLLKSGQPIALTPKVFETLVLLVRQAGHAVSKDELMKALWPRGYVDESNLTKHIWVIRRALGDGEHDSRFIETIPKLGYRFIAPVTAATPALPEAPAASSPAAAPAAPAAGPASPAVDNTSWSGRLWLAGAAALVALILIGSVWWSLRHRSEQAAATGPGRTVAFVGFSSLSHNPKDAWLGPALTEMLAAEVGIAENLQVVPDELVRDASAGLPAPAAGGYAPQTLERFRQRLDADYVVSGSYLVSGSAENAPLRLDIALQDTRSGKLLSAVSSQSALAGLIPLVTQAGTKLRDKLGGIPAAATLSLVANEQPPSIDVARRVGFALDALRHYDAARARDELLEAIAEAPGYAPAYTHLAQAWSALGYREKALAAAEQAAARADALPPHQRLQAQAVVQSARAQWAAAADTWQQLVLMSPANAEYRLQLIDAQLAADATVAAQKTLAELQRLPNVAGDPRVELAAARIAGARADAKGAAAHAAKALQQAQQRDATALVAAAQMQLAGARMHLNENEAARGDLSAAIAGFQALGNPRGEAAARGNLAGAWANLNHGQEAREEYQRALTLYQSIGDAEGVAGVYRDLCSMLWVAGDRDGAQTAARHSLELARETGDVGLQTWTLRALATIAADESASDEVLEQYREVIALAGPKGDIWSLTTLADVLRLRGNLAEAGVYCRRAYDDSSHLSDPQFAIYSGFTCAQIDVDKGHEQDARTALELVLRRVGTGGDSTYRDNALMLLAQLDMDHARWRSARGQLAEAAKGFAAAEESTGEADAQAMLALCDQALGDTAGRDAAANRARSLRRSINSRQEVYFVDIALARLDDAARAGSTAPDRLLTLAADAERRHWLAWSLEAKLAAWQLLKARQAPSADGLHAEIERTARAHGFGRILQQLERPGAQKRADAA